MRRSRFFWGIIVILIGVFLLLNTLGWIPANSWSFFWPVVLILLGVWFLLGPYLYRRNTAEMETLSIPLEGTQQGRVRIDFGAGKLELNATANAGELASGTCYGGVEKELRRSGTLTELRLHPPVDFMVPPFFMNTSGFQWQLGLSRDVPLELELHTGAGESLLDLRDLKVSELRLETGASANRVILPAQAGFTQARIKSGAASVEIQVPDGVAGRIHIESGLAGIKVDTSRFLPRGEKEYESPDYASAANRAEITIETGVGSLDIR